MEPALCWRAKQPQRICRLFGVNFSVISDSTARVPTTGPYIPTVPLNDTGFCDKCYYWFWDLFALSEHQSGRYTSGVYAPCRCDTRLDSLHTRGTSSTFCLTSLFPSHMSMPRALTCSPSVREATDAVGRKSMKAQSNKVEAYCNREENSYHWPLEMQRLKLHWQLPRAGLENWRERSSTYHSGKLERNINLLPFTWDNTQTEVDALSSPHLAVVNLEAQTDMLAHGRQSATWCRVALTVDLSQLFLSLPPHHPRYILRSCILSWQVVCQAFKAWGCSDTRVHIN